MKKHLIFSVVVGLVLLCGTSSEAQEKRVKMSDLPAAVQATVQDQSKGAKVRGYSSEVEKGKTLYEVELMVNGHSKDVSMDADGKVVEVEEEVAIASIPEEAREAIQKSAGKGKIVKVEAVTAGDSAAVYEASVSKSGKKSEVRVDAKGNPAPEE